MDCKSTCLFGLCFLFVCSSVLHPPLSEFHKVTAMASVELFLTNADLRTKLDLSLCIISIQRYILKKELEAPF